MATLLNDKEIAGLVGRVIVNGDASCVRTNSYVLRLGPAGEFLNSGKEFTLGGSKKGIRIQPGHSVALTAFETIDFRRETVRQIYPDHDLHALVSPSTDLSREGLVAPTTQVDVGYHGTLNWTLTNTSNEVRRFLMHEKIFRITFFKLAPGETPVGTYKGDYQGRTGYVRSERKGPSVGMRENEWEDSRIDGGPEALLENLIKSGYPWNLLGERLQIIDGQFQTVTNEYGEIKKAMGDMKQDMPITISNSFNQQIESVSSKWTVKALAGLGVLIGLILTTVTSDTALNFLKKQGYWVGVLIMVGAVVFFLLLGSRRIKK